MTKTRKLTEIAVAVAMAVVCSFIKVWEMPQGGSVALTMVPILLIAIRSGWVAGCACGAIYGVLSLLIAGVVYHPMSILLDYVLAFGLLGLAGLFKKNLSGLITGCTVGVAGRFASSLVSGAVLFAEYAPEGQNPWIYSLVYQATYMVPEFIISVAILVLLFLKARRLFEK
ncbi:MAG: energy-coupled thiamine transporter ThiT [Clostridia bacterium]|nr:energy-coupled thiamine transporter ThiT [Clostridia bacterium]